MYGSTGNLSNSISTPPAPGSLDDSSLGDQGNPPDINAQPVPPPAIIPQAPQGWFTRMANKAKNAIVGVVSYIKSHPVSTILAVVAALTPATNAGAQAVKVTTAELNGEVLKKLSPGAWTKFLANFLSSFSVNTIMNALFIPIAGTRLKTGLKQIFRSPKDFTENSLSILIGLGGGAAAFFLAYEASTPWLGDYGALAPAALSFISVGASRYASIKGIFGKVLNHFGLNAKTQRQYAEQLMHVRPQYTNELNATLFNLIRTQFPQRLINGSLNDQPFTMDELNSIAQEFAPAFRAFMIAHPDLVGEKATSEYVKAYARLTFDISFTLFIMAPTASLTFLLRGISGFDQMLKLMTGTGLEHWSVAQKVGLGFDPMIASMLTYTNTGMKASFLIENYLTYLYENPAQILPGTVLAAANYFGLYGPLQVGLTAIRSAEKNLHWKVDPRTQDTIGILNGIAGGAMNYFSCLEKVTPVTKPAKDFNVLELGHAIRNADERPLKAETMHLIRQSLFAQDALATEAQPILAHRPTL